MSKIQRGAPVLSVNSRSMKPMIDFFSDLLGFQVDTVLGKQPAFAMLSRDDNHVGLSFLHPLAAQGLGNLFLGGRCGLLRC